VGQNEVGSSAEAHAFSSFPEKCGDGGGVLKVKGSADKGDDGIVL
jgi:hypothetical protein